MGHHFGFLNTNATSKKFTALNLNQLLPIKDLIKRETSCPYVHELIDISISLFERLVKERGMKSAIAYFKRSRLHFTRFISGTPLLDSDGVAIDYRGLPKWMKYNQTDLGPNEYRSILTLLTLSRCFITKPEFKTQTITQSWGGAIPDFTRKEFHHILRQLNVRKWEWEWTEYHYSTKSGPNGQALASSKWDLEVLPDKLKDDLVLVGGRYVRDSFEGLQENNNFLINLWYQIFPKPTRKDFRKLSVFSDPEGKTRIIAILDYWSQTVLKPLHDRLNSILKGIKTDCTFNQDSFKRILPSSGPYHSLDLTAATDRMPIALQKVILSYIVGEKKTEAWARILTEWGYSHGNAQYHYNTGQPMGAYSSWPIMALTHHFIVRLAGLRSGLPHFNAYAILGDDIVIANDKVARKYREILSILDMPISESKSHVSNDTYEFAKRWIQNGVEITPFSFSGLITVWKRYYLYHNFVLNQQLHGWLSSEGDPEFILQKMMDLRGKVSQKIRSLKLYRLFALLPDILNVGDETAGNHFRDILGLPVPEGYTSTSWIRELCTAELVRQCEKEEHKLLLSKADFLIKIRDGLIANVPDKGKLHPTLQNLREYSPIMGVVAALQRSNTDTLIKLKTGTEQEILKIILGRDLVGTSINMNVFSMRSARSRIVSASTIVKPIMNQWKDYLRENLKDPSLVHRG